jgi:3-oxoacyl-[acyl-carrier protein] reductase
VAAADGFDDGPAPRRDVSSTFAPEAFGTRKIAPFVVWLCTDAAKDINGRSFNVGGDVVSRLSEPAPERSVYQEDGWDLKGLDAASVQLAEGLENPYRLDDHPEL